MSGRPDPAEPAIRTRWRPPFRVDVALVLAPLRHGRGDPTIRFEGAVTWRAARTPEGPATLRLAPGGDGIEAAAWGPGAAWAIERLPRLLGSEDDPDAFRPAEPRLRDLARRFPGLRFGRSDDVLGSLVPAILEQKVTGTEARRAWRALVVGHGEPAPGPGGLWLAPDPARLRRIPLADLHPLGIEERRGLALRRVADAAPALEAAVDLPAPRALERLRVVPGVGPWSAAETARSAFGDPDAVSVGDFHLPNLVCWALAGEPRGTDERMLELLEPWRGQRARLVRLLELSGLAAPRYGPRLAPRDIRGI